MTRDIPPLPWSDPARLWFAGSLVAAAIAASAVLGIVQALTRSWPETFTTDGSRTRTAATDSAADSVQGHFRSRHTNLAETGRKSHVRTEK
jgi:hypothetical protein